MSIGARLLIAVPWVLGVAFIGLGVGTLFGDPANGFRAGAVLGGIGAILHIRRKVRAGG